MTKDQAIAFLTEAGNVNETLDISETYARIAFKCRGTWLHWFTNSEDPDFLYLTCFYDLNDAVLDQLTVANILAVIQEDMKVVKLSADFERKLVGASAEQFVPSGRKFERIFWRTVDLVVHAASKARHEILKLTDTDAAAERFTEEIESELQLNGKGSSNSLQVLKIYNHEGTYVFDDSRVGLEREPFVQGMPEIIEHQFSGRPIKTVTAIFSATPFPGYASVLNRLRSEFEGTWYGLDGTNMEGWLCPALFRYFDAAPNSLYIQFKDATYQTVDSSTNLPAIVIGNSAISSPIVSG